MSTPAAVTVLICTRGRPVGAADAVRSVLAGRLVPGEVVIVDQSSSPDADLAAIVAGTTAVRYLHRPGRGLSRARNQGFEAATGDVVVLLDDDMYADEGWLEGLIAAGPGDQTIVTGRVLAAPLQPGEHPLPAAALITRAEAEEFQGRQALDVVPGAGVALPRRLVLDLGGYDERLGAGSSFPSAEDNDFGLRALEAGAVVRHAPEAISYHRGRPTARAVTAQRWAYGRGKGAFYAKHARRGDPYVRRRIVAELRLRLPRIVLFWRQPDVAWGDFVYLAGIAAGLTAWAFTERGRGQTAGS